MGADTGVARNGNRIGQKYAGVNADGEWYAICLCSIRPPSCLQRLRGHNAAAEGVLQRATPA